MNVIAFQPNRSGLRTWSHAELQRLIAFYSAHGAGGDFGSWEVAATEAQDPQFYLMSSSAELGCVLCISRVGRLYVAEDSQGRLIAENQDLRPVLDAASRKLERRWAAGFLVRSLFALCAFRIMIEQKLEPFLAESSENWARFAPHVAALI